MEKNQNQTKKRAILKGNARIKMLFEMFTEVSIACKNPAISKDVRKIITKYNIAARYCKENNLIIAGAIKIVEKRKNMGENLIQWAGNFPPTEKDVELIEKKFYQLGRKHTQKYAKQTKNVSKNTTPKQNPAEKEEIKPNLPQKTSQSLHGRIYVDYSEITPTTRRYKNDNVNSIYKTVSYAMARCYNNFIHGDEVFTESVFDEIEGIYKRVNKIKEFTKDDRHSMTLFTKLGYFESRHIGNRKYEYKTIKEKFPFTYDEAKRIANYCTVVKTEGKQRSLELKKEKEEELKKNQEVISTTTPSSVSELLQAMREETITTTLPDNNLVIDKKVVESILNEVLENKIFTHDIRLKVNDELKTFLSEEIKVAVLNLKEQLNEENEKIKIALLNEIRITISDAISKVGADILNLTNSVNNTSQNAYDVMKTIKEFVITGNGNE